ncbi:MAG: 50S ribosomal protein L11 methyltransferase [Chthoniobacterales bacterium]
MAIYLWQKSAARAWFDDHQARLEECGVVVIERPGRKRLSIEVTSDKETVARLTKAFGGRQRKLARNYLDKFLRPRKTKPIRIGHRLLITNAAVRIETPQLIIPAGAAFGTGEHATTAMSLRLLERVTRRPTSGWRMLDAGTGSGILALAGSRFGAQAVVAIDTDPLAISTALANAKRNGIDGVKFICGDVAKRIHGRFDIIAANLYSELLISVLPQFRKALFSDGQLILSGVMRNQERTLLRALKANALAVTEIRRRGKWIALLAQKQS